MSGEKSQGIFKKRLISKMHGMLDLRIDQLQNAIESAIESRNTATKSSAGDKHETGRALMQTEIDNLEKQLDNFVRLKRTLSQAQQQAPSESIGFGSLVKTNESNFYFSISLGKIEVEKETVFAVSPRAPLAINFIDKKLGDSVTFQNKIFKINQVL